MVFPMQQSGSSKARYSRCGLHAESGSAALQCGASMTVAPLSFLVVDYHRDSRFLLVKCLQRKFSGAGIYEAEETDTAVEIARRDAIAAIITHRTHDCLGTDLVAKFREANPTVPIIMVSGIDRTEAALAA